MSETIPVAAAEPAPVDIVNEKIRRMLRLALASLRDEQIADLAVLVARLRGEDGAESACDR